MDGDGVIEVLLRRAHPHGYRESLNHLIGARADHVYAHDALLRSNSYELHVSTWLAHGHSVIHGYES